ncbi:DUF2306 domain-containing protein [Antribacter gilvus]|uniref:DUF2306 domain-containing protein n=1 Tax=Antribacter gilvus TaxID=2304675 RepID=UPI001F0BE1FC|nr:DUF2306 domain-containing protein [Antribacter gilvus]
MTTTTVRASRREWLVPAGLLLLTVIPMLGGAVRLGDLASTPAVTPENARFVGDPFPVVVHIVAAVVYGVGGALQFAPSLRRRAWHRRAGRLLAPAGLVVALSGLWMTAAYDLPDGLEVVNAMRYLVGAGMAVSIVLGVRAAVRKDFVSHPAWMMRAYALAMGAGTQGVLGVAVAVTTGSTGLDPVTNTLVMGGGWAINVAVAEWIIRRRK